MFHKLNTEKIRHIVEQALEEDIGTGDITTNGTIKTSEEAGAVITAEQSGIIAGLPIANIVYESLSVKPLVPEGASVEKGQNILEVKGPAKEILTGERVVLNFLSYLSGIATFTRKFVDKTAEYGVTILDTRKTIPCMRILEKYAVVVGGGQNHRMGLYDRILVKDNHLKILEKYGPDFINRAVRCFENEEVEIEVQTVEQAKNAVEAGAHTLLLDNMDIEDVKEIVSLYKGKIFIEYSGGVDLNNIGDIAKTGVDYISIGALTHSAPIMNLSMEIL